MLNKHNSSILFIFTVLAIVHWGLAPTQVQALADEKETPVVCLSVNTERNQSQADGLKLIVHGLDTQGNIMPTSVLKTGIDDTIRIRVTFSNLGNDTVTLLSSNWDSGLRFEVSSEGLPVPLSRYGQFLAKQTDLKQGPLSRSFLPLFPLVLKPNQSQSYDIYISSMYDMTMFGEYSIVVHYDLLRHAQLRRNVTKMTELVAQPLTVIKNR